MRIRTATREDLSGLVELYGSVGDAMDGSPFDCCWRRGLYPSKEMLSCAIDAGTMLVGAFDGVLTAGVVCDDEPGSLRDLEAPWKVLAAPDETAFIHILAVHPRLRGRGLSRQVLDAAIERARAGGAATVRLVVASANLPAVDLYEAMGFEHVTRTVEDFGTRRVPACILERPLVPMSPEPAGSP